MILFKVENQRKHHYIQYTKSKLDMDFVEAKKGIAHEEKNIVLLIIYFKKDNEYILLCSLQKPSSVHNVDTTRMFSSSSGLVLDLIALEKYAKYIAPFLTQDSSTLKPLSRPENKAEAKFPASTYVHGLSTKFVDFALKN